jgi:hypothetical protein
MLGCGRLDKQLAGMPHTPCCTFGQPYMHVPADTNFAHPRDLTTFQNKQTFRLEMSYQLLNSSSDIVWPGLDFGMTAHLGDTTSQAAAKPWHVLDFLRRHARRLPEHEHAK